MLTAIITGIIVFLGNLLLLFYIKRKLGNKETMLFEALSVYFHKPNPETPSQFELQLEVIAQMYASRTANSIKTTVMGMNSVQSKNAAKLDSAITEDLLGQVNPLLGFLSGLPQARALIKSNPNILNMAMSMMSKQKGPGDNGQEKILTQEIE